MALMVSHCDENLTSMQLLASLDQNDVTRFVSYHDAVKKVVALDSIPFQQL